MATSLTSPQTQAFLLGTGNATSKARCTSPIAIPISSNAVYDFSWWEGNDSQFPDQCATLYIDNGGNTSPLTITLGSGQKIVFPGSSQGYVEVLQPNPVRIQIQNPSATYPATFQIISERIASYIWSAAAL